ncbi:PucR family transcriptional regulator [Zafaria sp. Z1313]|uniref:PucR family transcriptional regulator n=1 Tax=unclassified Zafaria TaxID=2828765 RepID=UPI002E79CC48|nr:PucR family transcriptional regulator [Zafaria sp. J156]MEE1621245.1 PucR family transcriptional regulator [Zafaria sp. J156]
MPLTLHRLLAAPGLGLRALTDPGARGGDAVQWAAVTELEDPTPFLGGGEVLLTTGLRQRTAAAQEAFVDRIAAAGVLALGYGTGLTHAKVPPGVVRRAAGHGLPVFEVPYATPFVAITRMVAEALAADHVGRVERLLRDHQQFAAALLGGGLDALLGALAERIGTPPALDLHGARIHGPGRAPEPPGPGWLPLPIATGLPDRCTLWIPDDGAGEGPLGYARSLIGLELANRARLRESRREAAGQVLADLVHAGTGARGSGSGDAELRLQSVGVAAAGRHAVVLVEAAEARALRTLPLPPGLGPAVGALIDGRLAVLLEADDAGAAAAATAAYLDGAGIAARVGYGGGYGQASGLRWSYFEAAEALRHGERLNRPSRLSLTSLLLSARDVPIHDLAAEAIGPLERFDAEHGAGLVETLTGYLEANGSVGAVAAALGLHRNTVRYRIQQIAELSGYDPTQTADRVQLWLALSARELS